MSIRTDELTGESYGRGGDRCVAWGLVDGNSAFDNDGDSSISTLAAGQLYSTLGIFDDDGDILALKWTNVRWRCGLYRCS